MSAFYMIGLAGAILCFLPLSLAVRCSKRAANGTEDKEELCIEFLIGNDAAATCSAFNTRKVGSIDDIQWGFETEDCSINDGYLVCRCGHCELPEIINITKSSKKLKRVNDMLQECLLTTVATTERTTLNETSANASKAKTLHPTRMKSSEPTTVKSPVTLEGFDDSDESLISGHYGDSSDTLFRGPPAPDPKFYGIRVEDVVIPYNNKVIFGGGTNSDSLEEKMIALTPSRYYNAVRQQQIYNISATALLMLNIFTFIGTIVFFRAILSATLYSIFPDHRML
ncbi:hypothetical protein GCK32_009669 [Trichostrongylus colubriformis]|uniref:Uncharacterized protein n=1 Tax=Trichostrongylus colubriformis TaxID=6319 RepID=A0AAN8IT59_TRICO